MKSINYKNPDSTCYVSSAVFYAVISSLFSKIELRKAHKCMAERINKMEEGMTEDEIDNDEYNCEFVMTDVSISSSEPVKIAFGKKCAFMIQMNGETTQFILQFAG